MRFGTVCSGIEAPSVAWGPLGWEPRFFSEVDPFCCELLRRYHPGVPNLGDISGIYETPMVDVLMGGTPCQSFSIAGKRQDLTDPRGNLTLEFLRLVELTRPRWVVWENVPGVLSIDAGRTFGAILGTLGELGYGFAYRVLDGQYFGIPQRRRRVFVVGCTGGDWRGPASVLFEPQGVHGDHTPGRKKAEALTRNVPPGSGESGGGREGGVWAFGGNNSIGPIQVATACRVQGGSWHGDFESETFVVEGCSPWRVRRLTPRECERLQGFPDDYTLIEYKGRPAADSNRYRVLGNTMAVPVVRWLGERIEMVEWVRAHRGRAPMEDHGPGGQVECGTEARG